MTSLLPPVQPVIEKLLLIVNKQGETVPFILNPIQKYYHDHRVLRSDILKSRQMGFTSFIMAWFLVECLRRTVRAVMVAQDKDSTSKLLQRFRFYVDNIRGAPPEIERMNDNEVLFKRFGSSFYIGTAGSRQVGRSDTITHLHCSEIAHWKNPEDITLGLFQAVPHKTGVIVKETTANGYGNWHHAQYQNAVMGVSRYKAFFFPYNLFEEYSSDTPLIGDYTPEEQELVKNYDLSCNQIQWRREKLTDDFSDNKVLFQQEYPLTAEEAFRVSGGSLFPLATHTSSQSWEHGTVPGFGGYSYLKPHPIKGRQYSAGIDPSGGTGGDFSEMHILDAETFEQVLVFRTNTLNPPRFTEACAVLGAMFNEAFIVPEASQHGLSVIDCLKNYCSPYKDNWARIYRMRFSSNKSKSTIGKIQNYGFITGRTSKFRLISLLQKFLPEITLHDASTADQLRGFGELGDGTLGNTVSGHDDAVMALGLALEGVMFLGLHGREIEEEEEEQKYTGFRVTFEDIMEGLNSSDDLYGFKSQHLSGGR